MKADNIVALRGALAAAAVHRERVLAAMERLADRMPRNGADIAAMEYADIASAELLLSRFAKLQDLLGARLFPLAAAASEEPLRPDATFLDLLHRLEKVGAIPSAAGWRRLRELRNELAHDYPDDVEAAAVALASVMRAAPDLLAVLARVQAHVERTGVLA